MTSPGHVARAAETIHWAFDDYHQRFRSITRRAKKRFERRDWEGVRQDTVERLGLHGQCVRETLGSLQHQLGDELRDRELWSRLKTVYTERILADAAISREAFPTTHSDQGSEQGQCRRKHVQGFLQTEQ